MPACWAMAEVGQRSTTHFVWFTRWSCTGFISRVTNWARAAGTSEASKILAEPRSAI